MTVQELIDRLKSLNVPNIPVGLGIDDGEEDFVLRKFPVVLTNDEDTDERIVRLG